MKSHKRSKSQAAQLQLNGGSILAPALFNALVCLKRSEI
jgi:hypothetical protein